MKVYIAGPLFNEMERDRNAQIKALLNDNGFQCYLPQEDGGVSYDLIEKGAEKSKTRTALFKRDFQAVSDCDVMLCILDGRVPDEGMCIELGMAYALNKRCIGYKTDSRALDKYGDNNIMIDGCLLCICTSLDDLLRALTDLCKA